VALSCAQWHHTGLKWVTWVSETESDEKYELLSWEFNSEAEWDR